MCFLENVVFQNYVCKFTTFIKELLTFYYNLELPITLPKTYFIYHIVNPV